MKDKQNKKKIKKLTSLFEQVLDTLELEITDSVKDTPKRVAKMYVNELFSSINGNSEEFNSLMTLFDAPNNEPITIETPFYSMCEHHLLPFYGTVKVTYIPSDKIIGLSKIPRVVDYFSRKPQLQERLTQEIGEYLFDLLKPQWLDVYVVAEHMCVSMRGAKEPCKTSTHWHGGV